MSSKPQRLNDLECSSFINSPLAMIVGDVATVRSNFVVGEGAQCKHLRSEQS